MRLFCRWLKSTPVFRYLILGALSFPLNSFLFSQDAGRGFIVNDNNFYNEGLLVSTDRNLYISGETVWLKIYKVNGLTGIPVNLSKTVYVEAVDTAGIPFVQLKVNVDGYSGSASFRLPDTIRSGEYVIRSYTSWMRNFSEDLFSLKSISVLNPYVLPDLRMLSTHKASDNNTLQNRSPSSHLQAGGSNIDNAIPSSAWNQDTAGKAVNFKIKAGKSSYSRREKISVEISATDSRGYPLVSDFSLSVAKAVTINNPEAPNVIYRQVPVRHEVSPQDLSVFLPELEGHLITGIIRDRATGEPLKNQNITLSFVGKTALCKFAKTNEKGVFHFNTTETGPREIVIQPLPDLITEYYVELDNPFTSSVKKYRTGGFLIDTSKLVQLNDLIICTQINNMYAPYNQKAHAGKNLEKDSHDFFGKSENTIVLSKYIELTSLKEIIKELIPGVMTVNRKGEMNFRLFYQYQSVPYENKPLVLVDGVPVYDIDKVLSIREKDVEKIDVFITRYYILDIVLDGILDFITRKGDLSAVDLGKSGYRVEYDLPGVADTFYSPDYSGKEMLYNHIPDFRNTLYWNPSLLTDKKGNARAEFFSSDDAGEYTVIVEGMTADGRRGSARISLKID